MESIKNEYLSVSVDADGVATLVIDQVNNPTNLFSTEFMEHYFDATGKLIENEDVKGVIVTSGQRLFMAGADLKSLGSMGSGVDVEDFLQGALLMHRRFRSNETAGKPFVAAINGTCLGGGLELALTCHHRIALNSSKIKIGFPETKVGLFPGGGGVAKSPYLMGIQNTMMYILQGKEVRPAKALSDGLIGELAEDQADMLAKAKAWILANPKAMQPWDNKKHRMPGGGLMTPNGFQTMMGGIGNLRKMTHGNYPGMNNALSALHDGLTLPIDRALEVEARYFVATLNTKEAQNMIRTGFFAIQDASKGKGRPKDEPKYNVGKLGILGAGMMGAGIAYVSAMAGMDVVLKDVTQENAEKGKSYSESLLKKRVSKKRMTEEKAAGVLAKITATDDPNSMKGCDLVIEAVFENQDLKATVTKQTESVMDADKIYASNTSTIPITLLAKASERPESFVGIHFFSPVDKMPLVEIIAGEKTSDKAIAAAVDYVVAIRKVPIVVNDGRGFFTSRCFGTYTSEGTFLLDQGVPAAMIENVAKTAGMPVGPLAVQDEVAISLAVHVMESDPRTMDNPAMKRLYDIYKEMVDSGRAGKKAGAGFYEYPEGGKKYLWKELSTKFKSDVDTLDKSIVKRRLLHRQAIESFRCLEEGVLKSAKDGDIGSILGWGFPIYTGGALSYIDYVGMDKFIAECDEFAETVGPRFAVPDALRKLAAEGKSIHEFRSGPSYTKSAVKKMKEAELVDLANSIGIAATVDDLKKDTLEKVLAKLAL